MDKEELDKMKEELGVLSDKRKRQDDGDAKDPVLEKEYSRLYQKIYYEENKETLKETQFAYREKHREAIALNSREYYHANKDGAIKEYREENKEKLQEYRRQYYLKNKEACLARVKAYQKKLKDNE